MYVLIIIYHLAREKFRFWQAGPPSAAEMQKYRDSGSGPWQRLSDTLAARESSGPTGWRRDRPSRPTNPTHVAVDGRTGRSFGATPTLNSTLLQCRGSGLWRAPTGAVLLLSSLSRRAVGRSCCLHSSSAWPQPTTSRVKKIYIFHFSKDTSTMLNLFSFSISQ